MRSATAFVVANVREDAELVGSVAVNYLMLVGYACGAWQWALAARAAREDAASGGPGATLAPGLLDAAKFYAAAVLPRATLHAELVQAGSASIVEANIDAI